LGLGALAKGRLKGSLLLDEEKTRVRNPETTINYYLELWIADLRERLAKLDCKISWRSLSEAEDPRSRLSRKKKFGLEVRQSEGKGGRARLRTPKEP